MKQQEKMIQEWGIQRLGGNEAGGNKNTIKATRCSRTSKLPRRNDAKVWVKTTRQ